MKWPLPCRRRGFTLLEMLVTLVIVAMIATILGQALVQLARIERLLEGGQLRSATASLRAEWVRDALAALLPGSTEATRMHGSERELSGMSSDVPQMPVLGVAPLRLRLVSGAGATRLEMLPEGDPAPAAVVLLQWPGAQGRFRYLDAQGQWHDHWPMEFADVPLGTMTTADATAAAATALPRAIGLETGAEGPGWILAVPLASRVPEPTRAQLEDL